MSHLILAEYLLWSRHYAKCPEKKRVMINDVNVPPFSEIISVFPTSAKARDRHYLNDLRVNPSLR